MGGEKTSADRPRIADIGSPPRGRGKVSSVSMCTRSPGITPAWAGKSCPERLKTASALDHPRVGGEKRQARTYTASCQGSPPRGRGKAYIFPTFWGVERITPAWAGKSAAITARACWPRDHPRVGGEKDSELFLCRTRVGSPPRGRGKVQRPKRRKPGSRITPAWAGKSSSSMRVVQSSRDHPRVGGEKIIRMTTPKYPVGSPPRGRGKD